MLAVGLVWLLYGSLRLSKSAQRMLAVRDGGADDSATQVEGQRAAGATRPLRNFRLIPLRGLQIRVLL